jgi:hypothetical protein
MELGLSSGLELDVESTALYGVRIYSEGAVLEWHVDKLSTHVLAAIVHVGRVNVQHGPSGAWPLQIFDHAGRAHSVDLDAGEMLIYESASLLHARLAPLRGKGAQFANMFFHYRPANGSWRFDKTAFKSY